MKHLLKVSGNQVKVVLIGKIFAHDAGILREELLEAIERGATDISMDLTQLAYIDSSGLGVLVTVHKRTGEKNGRVVFTGVQGMAAKLLERTRLDKVLTIE
jgi:anti-sigma B factor antagonist